ncbi:MAG: DUF5362 family protein [Gammaproteobacteria bacterium]|nr:DUF5362 family protein [Gammaproteobacteria bacterium]
MSGNVTNGVSVRRSFWICDCEEVLVVDVRTLLTSLIKNAIWLKILGVVLFVYGVFLCISIVGLLVGWLPIWLGVLLFSSAKRLDVIKEEDSPEDAVESIEKISLFFKISGIVTLVYVVFLVLILLFFFVRGISGVMGFG